MAASPTRLSGVIGIVQAVGHHVQETGRIALNTPQELGIDLAHGTLALDQALVFVPV